MGSQLGSFGKGGSDFRVSREMLAAQLCIIDVAGSRPCPQNFARRYPSFGREFEETLPQHLVRRQPGNCEVVQFV